MIKTLAISNYRSLRDLRLPLGQISVIEGPNGSGKTNIYRALRLLVDAAKGRLIQSLSREGGLASVLWAGPEVVSRRIVGWHLNSDMTENLVLTALRKAIRTMY